MRDVMHWMWDMQEPQASYLCFLLNFIISLQENTSVMLLTNCTKENATISSDVILAR